MECPACSAVVNPADVVGGVGRCQWCDHIWDTGDVPSAPSPPVEPEASLTRVARPDGVEVIEEKDGVRIRIPWQAQLTLQVHAIFWGSGLLLLMSILSGELAGLFVVAPFLVIYLYLMVNVTELRLRPDGVETHHGPLTSPMDPDVSVSAAQLATLRVRSEVMKYRISTPSSYTRGRLQVTTHYSLYAGHTRLLRKFADRSLVTYVAQVIQETLDTPVHIVQEDDPTPRSASEWARR